MGRNASATVCTIVFAIFAFASCVFTSCASLSFREANPQEYDESFYIPKEEEIEWLSIEENNDCASYFIFESLEKPLLKYAVVKINLLSKNLRIISYPENAIDGKAKGIRIEDFQQNTKAQIVINTTQYAIPKGRLLARLFPPFSNERKIIGITRSNGKTISEPEERYAMLTLSEIQNGFEAKIIAHQNARDAENSDFAIGGYFVILQDGKLFDSSGNDFAYTSRNSRTAVALADGGQTLLLLSVAGEDKSESRGLTYPECAKVLQSLGAVDAMQFDGGGSSALLINGKKTTNTLSKRKNASYIAFLFCNISTF